MKRFELAEAFDVLDGYFKTKKLEDTGDGTYAKLLKMCAAAAQRGSAANVIEQCPDATPIRAWYDVRELLDDNDMENVGVYEIVRDSVQFCIDTLDLPGVEHGEN